MSRARTELQQLTIDGGHEVVAILDKQPTWGGRRKGAGRPRTCAGTNTVSIRVSYYTFACLKAAAAAQDTTPSAIVKRLVLQGLELREDGPNLPDPITIL